MTLIDAHVHVWDPRRLEYPWLSGLDIDRPHLPDDVDRANGRTTAMVFVQADCTPEQALDEVRWVNSFGDGWPELAAIVAAADLHDANGLPAALNALAAERRVVGIRHLLQSEPDEVFDDETFRGNLQLLAQRGLSFDACVTHRQLPALVRLLEPVDGLRVVIDHLGKPPVDAGITSEEGRRWAESITALAALPGAHVKVSGLAPEASSHERLHAHAPAFIEHAVEAFGPDRSMLGSDWPVSAAFGARGGFADWVALVLESTRATASEREALEFRTAASFYGIED